VRLVFSGLAGLGLIALAGCSSISVNHSYDPGADFGELRTYAWIPVPDASGGDELTIKNVQYSVNKRLREKGFVPTSSAPDFLVAIHGGKEKKVDVQQWGYTYADRNYYLYDPYPMLGRYGYAAPRQIQYRQGVDVYEYELGTLVLDFVNPGNKELIWRGTATAVVSDPVSAAKIDQAVVKLLEGFPPPKSRP